MRAVITALGCLVAAGCSSGPTLRVVVESDLAVPAELDEVRVEIAGRTATAHLTDGAMLPAEVQLRSSGERLGPYELTVRGLRAGTEVAAVTQPVSFPAQGTSTVTVRLDASCAGVTCDPGSHCEAGACVPDGIDGGMPDDGGLDAQVPDAGADAGDFDACLPDELCDARDDDCDGEVDETGCDPCVHQAAGGHVYLACDLAMTWDAARAYCMEREYDLVIVDGMTENGALTMAPLSGEPWIGLHREAGEFVWVDGTPLGTFSPWQGAGPGSSADCVTLRGNGNWHTMDCADTHPFVCEVAVP